jgi:adenylate cyclase
MERRQAAILAADVVGYSRLMGKDEVGTLQALRAHREELIAPKIAEHDGHVVRLIGDGLLAEFPSAVEAVHCAVEIQQKMGDRNVGVPEERRIIYRMGINIGDIIAEHDDIHGDCVNVAARLEAFAQPGGVCISRTVFNHVKAKVEFGFEDLGAQRFKNIAEPVQVFSVKHGDVGMRYRDPSSANLGLPLPDKPSIAVLPFDNMSGDPE